MVYVNAYADDDIIDITALGHDGELGKDAADLVVIYQRIVYPLDIACNSAYF